MTEPRPVIGLLTDFGAASVYVGQMKAVILGICRDAAVFDLAHDIPPGAPETIVREGAFLLERSVEVLPEGAVICAVVDPGVGTARRAIAARVGTWTWVGPDNGLLVPAIARARRLLGERVCAVHLTDPALFRPHPSSTFHGRDLFAPAAAHLAGGLPIERAGPPLVFEELQPPPGALGTVCSVDRFGNLITDLEVGSLGDARGLEVGGQLVTELARTFAEGPPEEAFLTVGGLGTIEIVCRSASAAERIGAARGAAVTPTRSGRPRHELETREGPACES